MMTREQIASAKAAIDGLDRWSMCRLWRFAPAGHGWFTTDEVFDHFIQRFTRLGGFSPAISKALGWQQPSNWTAPTV